MMDPETKRAWQRLRGEVKENAPIVLRGLASSGKRLPSRLYKAVVRGCKSLIQRARGLDLSPAGRKELRSQLSRLRVRSPFYKV